MKTYRYLFHLFSCRSTRRWVLLSVPTVTVSMQSIALCAAFGILVSNLMTNADATETRFEFGELAEIADLHDECLKVTRRPQPTGMRAILEIARQCRDQGRGEPEGSDFHRLMNRIEREGSIAPVEKKRLRGLILETGATRSLALSRTIRDIAQRVRELPQRHTSTEAQKLVNASNQWRTEVKKWMSAIPLNSEPNAQLRNSLRLLALASPQTNPLAFVEQLDASLMAFHILFLEELRRLQRVHSVESDLLASLQGDVRNGIARLDFIDDLDAFLETHDRKEDRVTIVRALVKHVEILGDPFHDSNRLHLGLAALCFTKDGRKQITDLENETDGGIQRFLVPEQGRTAMRLVTAFGKLDAFIERDPLFAKDDSRRWLVPFGDFLIQIGTGATLRYDAPAATGTKQDPNGTSKEKDPENTKSRIYRDSAARVVESGIPPELILTGTVCVRPKATGNIKTTVEETGVWGVGFRLRHFDGVFRISVTQATKFFLHPAGFNRFSRPKTGLRISGALDPDAGNVSFSPNLENPTDLKLKVKAFGRDLSLTISGSSGSLDRPPIEDQAQTFQQEARKALDNDRISVRYEKDAGEMVFSSRLGDMHHLLGHESGVIPLSEEQRKELRAMLHSAATADKGGESVQYTFLSLPIRPDQSLGQELTLDENPACNLLNVWRASWPGMFSKCRFVDSKADLNDESLKGLVVIAVKDAKIIDGGVKFTPSIPLAVQKTGGLLETALLSIGPPLLSGGRFRATSEGLELIENAVVEVNPTDFVPPLSGFSDKLPNLEFTSIQAQEDSVAFSARLRFSKNSQEGIRLDGTFQPPAPEEFGLKIGSLELTDADGAARGEVAREIFGGMPLHLDKLTVSIDTKNGDFRLLISGLSIGDAEFGKDIVIPIPILRPQGETLAKGQAYLSDAVAWIGTQAIQGNIAKLDVPVNDNTKFDVQSISDNLTFSNQFGKWNISGEFGLNVKYGSGNPIHVCKLEGDIGLPADTKALADVEKWSARLKGTVTAPGELYRALGLSPLRQLVELKKFEIVRYRDSEEFLFGLEAVVSLTPFGADAIQFQVNTDPCPIGDLEGTVLKDINKGIGEQLGNGKPITLDQGTGASLVLQNLQLLRENGGAVLQCSGIFPTPQGRFTTHNLRFQLSGGQFYLDAAQLRFQPVPIPTSESLNERIKQLKAWKESIEPLKKEIEDWNTSFSAGGDHDRAHVAGLLDNLAQLLEELKEVKDKNDDPLNYVPKSLPIPDGNIDVFAALPLRAEVTELATAALASINHEIASMEGLRKIPGQTRVLQELLETEIAAVFPGASVKWPQDDSLGPELEMLAGERIAVRWSLLVTHEGKTWTQAVRVFQDAVGKVAADLVPPDSGEATPQPVKEADHDTLWQLITKEDEGLAGVHEEMLKLSAEGNGVIGLDHIRFHFQGMNPETKRLHGFIELPGETGQVPVAVEIAETGFVFHNVETVVQLVFGEDYAQSVEEADHAHFRELITGGDDGLADLNDKMRTLSSGGKRVIGLDHIPFLFQGMNPKTRRLEGSIELPGITRPVPVAVEIAEQGYVFYFEKEQPPLQLISGGNLSLWIATETPDDAERHRFVWDGKGSGLPLHVVPILAKDLDETSGALTTAHLTTSGIVSNASVNASADIASQFDSLEGSAIAALREVLRNSPNGIGFNLFGLRATMHDIEDDGTASCSLRLDENFYLPFPVKFEHGRPVADTVAKPKGKDGRPSSLFEFEKGPFRIKIVPSDLQYGDDGLHLECEVKFNKNTKTDFLYLPDDVSVTVKLKLTDAGLEPRWREKVIQAGLQKFSNRLGLFTMGEGEEKRWVSFRFAGGENGFGTLGELFGDKIEQLDEFLGTFGYVENGPSGDDLAARIHLPLFDENMKADDATKNEIATFILVMAQDKEGTVDRIHIFPETLDWDGLTNFVRDKLLGNLNSLFGLDPKKARISVEMDTDEPMSAFQFTFNVTVQWPSKPEEELYTLTFNGVRFEFEWTRYVNDLLTETTSLKKILTELLSKLFPEKESSGESDGKGFGLTLIPLPITGNGTEKNVRLVVWSDNRPPATADFVINLMNNQEAIRSGNGTAKQSLFTALNTILATVKPQVEIFGASLELNGIEFLPETSASNEEGYSLRADLLYDVNGDSTDDVRWPVKLVMLGNKDLRVFLGYPTVTGETLFLASGAKDIDLDVGMLSVKPVGPALVSDDGDEFREVNKVKTAYETSGDELELADTNFQFPTAFQQTFLITVNQWKKFENKWKAKDASSDVTLTGETTITIRQSPLTGIFTKEPIVFDVGEGGLVLQNSSQRPMMILHDTHLELNLGGAALTASGWGDLYHLQESPFSVPKNFVRPARFGGEFTYHLAKEGSVDEQLLVGQAEIVLFNRELDNHGGSESEGIRYDLRNQLNNTPSLQGNVLIDFKTSKGKILVNAGQLPPFLKILSGHGIEIYLDFAGGDEGSYMMFVPVKTEDEFHAEDIADGIEKISLQGWTGRLVSGDLLALRATGVDADLPYGGAFSGNVAMIHSLDSDLPRRPHWPSFQNDIAKIGQVPTEITEGWKRVLSKERPAFPNKGDHDRPNWDQPFVRVIDDYVMTAPGKPVEIDVLGNDLRIPSVGELSEEVQPKHGKVEVVERPNPPYLWKGGDFVPNKTPDDPSDNVLLYRPDPGFIGVDTFLYKICDGSKSQNCDTGEVKVRVVPPTPFFGENTFYPKKNSGTRTRLFLQGDVDRPWRVDFIYLGSHQHLWLDLEPFLESKQRDVLDRLRDPVGLLRGSKRLHIHHTFTGRHSWETTTVHVPENFLHRVVYAHDALADFVNAPLMMAGRSIQQVVRIWENRKPCTENNCGYHPFAGSNGHGPVPDSSTLASTSTLASHLLGPQAENGDAVQKLAASLKTGEESGESTGKGPPEGNGGRGGRPEENSDKPDGPDPSGRGFVVATTSGVADEWTPPPLPPHVSVENNNAFVHYDGKTTQIATGLPDWANTACPKGKCFVAFDGNDTPLLIAWSDAFENLSCFRGSNEIAIGTENQEELRSRLLNEPKRARRFFQSPPVVNFLKRAIDESQAVTLEFVDRAPPLPVQAVCLSFEGEQATFFAWNGWEFIAVPGDPLTEHHLELGKGTGVDADGLRLSWAKTVADASHYAKDAGAVLHETGGIAYGRKIGGQFELKMTLLDAKTKDFTLPEAAEKTLANLTIREEFLAELHRQMGDATRSFHGFTESGFAVLQQQKDGKTSSGEAHLLIGDKLSSFQLTADSMKEELRNILASDGAGNTVFLIDEEVASHDFLSGLQTDNAPNPAQIAELLNAALREAERYRTVPNYKPSVSIMTLFEKVTTP